MSPASSRNRGTLRGSSQLRLRAALIFLTMVLTLFGARLLQLQGLDPKAYAARAEAEGLVQVELPAARGDIVDRNGAPLATSVAGRMIVADPKQTAKNAPAIARLLADRLGLDYFTSMKALTAPDTRFQYVARRIPSTKATRVVQEITNAGYKGVATRNDPVRDYPAGDVAANLLGIMNAENQPAGGFELVFDKLLAGRDGHDTYEVGGGNRIPLGENTEVRPVNGKKLTLTIDRDANWLAQRLLRQTVHDSGAQSAALVAMDVRTGELLSLADYPSFDPTKPVAEKDTTDPRANRLTSRALTDVYEPGSVEKVLTASALVDQRLVTPQTRIVVPPELPVADRVIHDYFVHPKIHLTMAGVIAKSSNIGTVIADRQIKNTVLGSYLEKFGLGEKTGLGVPGESRGIVPDPSTWSPLTQATISFGQGLSVNAVQMAAAVNTIANGGEYVSPSIIEGSAEGSQGVVGTDTAVRRQVMSKATATAVTRMMEMVTTEGYGTAPGAKVVGYRTAGKTGTAQQVGAQCKCYDGSLAVSFAGFAPADNPRFTVYVVVQKPSGGASGGGTAGPVVRKMLSYLLQKYAVPPTGTKEPRLPVEW